MNRRTLTPTLRHPLRRSAVAAATALLLVACGGGDDADDTPVTPQASALKIGDQYTVAVQVGDQAPISKSLRVYGITEELDVVSSDNGKLIPGSLFALPDAGDAKEARADRPSMDEIAALVRDMRERLREIMRAQDEVNRRIIHNTGIKSADTDAHLAVVRELADLPTVVADLSRSGLTPLEYVEFYDALDVAPGFATQDDAEGQLISFFQTVQDEAEQGYSCGNINPWRNPCGRPKAAATEGSAATAPAYVPNQKDFLAALAAQGLSWKDFLAHMNARGQDFAHLLLAFNDWAAATSPATDAKLFPAFIAAYLAGDAVKAAQLQQTGEIRVMDERGWMGAANWLAMESWGGKPHVQGYRNWVLATRDSDYARYSCGTQGQTEWVKVSFEGRGYTAGTQLRLEGAYDARHLPSARYPGLPGRWIPRMSIEAGDTSVLAGFQLTARASVEKVFNAGTRSSPVPEVQMRVVIAQGSGAFLTKVGSVWFRAHGTKGFSVLH